MLSYVCEQNDDQRSNTTASDEDGSFTPRSVRFVERAKEASDDASQKNELSVRTSLSDSESNPQKDNSSSTQR
jgi:hypothetical protein